jgi:hypothetical protein
VNDTGPAVNGEPDWVADTLYAPSGNDAIDTDHVPVALHGDGKRFDPGLTVAVTVPRPIVHVPATVGSLVTALGTGWSIVRTGPTAETSAERPLTAPDPSTNCILNEHVTLPPQLYTTEPVGGYGIERPESDQLLSEPQPVVHTKRT